MKNQINYFKLSTVRQKIALLLIIGFICGSAIALVNKISDMKQTAHFKLSSGSYEIALQILGILKTEKDYIVSHQSDKLSEISAKRKQVVALVEDIKKIAPDPEAQSMLNQMILIEKEYGSIFEKIANQIQAIDEEMLAFVKTMHQASDISDEIMAMITKRESFLIMEGETISINEVSLRDILKNLQINLKTKFNDILTLFLFSNIQDYNNRKAVLQETFEKDKKNISYLIGALNEKEYTEKWNQINLLNQKIYDYEAHLLSEWKAITELKDELEAQSKTIQEIALKQAYMTQQKIHLQSKKSDTITALIGLIGGLIFLVLGFLISKNIRNTLLTVVHGLNEGASQISSASLELSSGSQSLARLASDQASSVEETNSALEEMVVMCKDMSILSQDTDRLMNKNIEKSAESLKNLVLVSKNMAQIESDNSRVGNIIKTIDEIAFQTNLLSLNAAVEAARAGESGAGFAVVADEVRNLAIRSASAAKDTQNLLQATIERVNHAANSLKLVSDDFEAIIESAAVMGEKTSSITEASQRQENGIGQVRIAMNEINKGSQQSAAYSEESAAAAEELAAQVEQLQNYVTVLMRLI